MSEVLLHPRSNGQTLQCQIAKPPKVELLDPWPNISTSEHPPGTPPQPLIPGVNRDCGTHHLRVLPYRGTSITRKRHPLGPYGRHMPRVLGRPYGGGCFLMSGVPHVRLYLGTKDRPREVRIHLPASLGQIPLPLANISHTRAKTASTRLKRVKAQGPRDVR